MKWQCYSVAGTSFHFGRLSGTQEESAVVFPSDSLFAALVHTAAQTEDPERFREWISSFVEGEPPLLLTSAFPRAGAVRFFPMPFLRDRIDFEALGITLKDIKKTAFISEALFRGLIHGEPVSLVYDPSVTVSLQGKSVRITKDEFETLPAVVKKEGTIWKNEKRPRVTLDRETSASSIFFSGYVDFAPECGLWFAVSDHSPSVISVEELLYELADQGFGGLRGIGFGAAALEKTDLIELPDADGPRWISLGRYLPAEDEVPDVFDGEVSYALEEVGGWLYSPGVKSERRRTVHMVAEGSVLIGIGKTLYGSIADVQPDYDGTRPVGHPVWRSGYAAAVGID